MKKKTHFILSMYIYPHTHTRHMHIHDVVGKDEQELVVVKFGWCAINFQLDACDEVKCKTF